MSESQTVNFEAILQYGDDHFDRFTAHSEAEARQRIAGRRNPPNWWRIVEHKADGTFVDVAASESAAAVLAAPGHKHTAGKHKASKG